MLSARSLLLFCLSMCSCVVSFSQEDTLVKKTPNKNSVHSISIGVGAMTPDFLCDGYRPGRPTTFDYANKGSSWVFYLSYQYQFHERAHLGITVTGEQQHGDWLDNVIWGGNVFDLRTTVKGSFIRTCYTGATEIVLDYTRSGTTRLYTVMGVGATYEFETDQYNPDFYKTGYYNGVNRYGPMRAKNNKIHFNGYYAPVGFRTGKRLCYFLEMGFGYKGVVNTGFSYKF